LDKEPAHRAALKKVFEAKAPKVLLFGALDGKGAADAGLAAEMDAAALAHPDLKYIRADAADNEGALTFFGLTAADLPAAVVHDTTSGDKKYVRSKVTSLSEFISEFKAGSLAPTVKSEPIPTDTSAPVTILVAKNFDAIVGQPAAAGKTILLEFYAPWCGHCKTLAPIYELLGKKFASREDIIIAKMDATANDVTDSRFEVKGFPTLFLQDGTGAVVPYEGERTEAALAAFVELHAGKGGAEAAKEVKDEL
jgi:protein disulfide-isomerase A1